MGGTEENFFEEFQVQPLTMGKQADEPQEDQEAELSAMNQPKKVPNAKGQEIELIQQAKAVTMSKIIAAKGRVLKKGNNGKHPGMREKAKKAEMKTLKQSQKKNEE